MKQSITLLLPLILLAASCGTTAQYSAHRFEDGLYVVSSVREVKIYSPEEFEQRAAMDLACKKSFSENDYESYSVIIVPSLMFSSWCYDPWYYDSWDYYRWNRGWRDPWYYNSWRYNYRYYDPWYNPWRYDPWYHNPWRYDPWYYDPWRYDHWYYDPWYGPYWHGGYVGPVGPRPPKPGLSPNGNY